MDPINPWLDPIEVRQLAERLMKPNRDTALDAADTGFDEAFVGFASDRPEPRSTSTSPPSGAAVPSTPTCAPQDHPTTARGAFLERILLFRDWLRRDFSATGIFILDHEGAVIFDESNHGRLHFLARSLALSSRRQETSSGNVHVKIGAGATLAVIPVETNHGWLVLGAVVPGSLSPAAVVAVMDGLAQVAA
jgi:hypothetical protein